MKKNIVKTVTTSNDLFLLVEIEVFDYIDYSQYAYLSSYNTTNNRIKYYDNADSISASSSLGVSFAYCT